MSKNSVFETPWGEGQVEAIAEAQDEEAQTRAEAAGELLKMFGDNYFEMLGDLDVSRLPPERPPAEQQMAMVGIGYDPTLKVQVSKEEEEGEEEQTPPSE